MSKILIEAELPNNMAGNIISVIAQSNDEDRIETYLDSKVLTDENTNIGIHPQRLLTDIHQIQNAKKEMDQDLAIAINTIVDRFKEKTNLYIHDIQFEMHDHKNHRHGSVVNLDRIITGVKTKVEI